jgi:hypothetical protein
MKRIGRFSGERAKHVQRRTGRIIVDRDNFGGHAEAALRILAKAERIIGAARPPARISDDLRAALAVRRAEDGGRQGL